MGLQGVLSNSISLIKAYDFIECDFILDLLGLDDLIGKIAWASVIYLLRADRNACVHQGKIRDEADLLKSVMFDVRCRLSCGVRTLEILYKTGPCVIFRDSLVFIFV